MPICSPAFTRTAAPVISKPNSQLGVCHCEALRRKEPDEQGKDNLVELEVEGLTLKIPFVWDENCGKYVLDYPDYLKQPTYTPDGWRIMLT